MTKSEQSFSESLGEAIEGALSMLPKNSHVYDMKIKRSIEDKLKDIIQDKEDYISLLKLFDRLTSEENDKLKAENAKLKNMISRLKHKLKKIESQRRNRKTF